MYCAALCRTALAVSLMLTTSSIALAQESAQPEEDAVARLGTITVSAQKRDQSLQDIPLSVTALSEELIKDRGLSTIGDIASSLPAVQFSEFSGSGNVSIRGIGTAIVSGAGESSTAMHLDGIFLTQPKAFTMIQQDLARVEILKGPQGTLYGRNSTAGVINFISARPQEEFEAGGSVLYGNYDRIKADAYLTGPLGDKVSARISAQYENRAGYITNVATGQEVDDLQAFGARLALDADLSDTWQSQLTLSYRDESFAGPVYDSFDANFAVPPVPEPFLSQIIALDPREVNSPVLYDSSKDLIIASLRNTFELSSNLQLVSLTGYSEFNESGRFDGIGSLLLDGNGLPLGVPLDRTASSEAISQEFNLVGNGDRLEWLAGAFYYSEDIKNDSVTDLGAVTPPPFGPLPAGIALNIVDQASEKSGYSVFADGTYSLTDRTRIFGGARWLREELDQRLTTVGVCDGSITPQSFSDEALTGRVGLQHDVHEGVMVYGQYSRGYKVGGFSQSTCNNPYGSETIDAFEIGLKSDLLQNRLRFNAAVFHYDSKNLQLEQATPTGIPVVNAPRASVLGADFEMNALLSDALSVDATLSLLDSQYDEFINTDPLLGALPGADLSGIALNYAPAYSFNIGANWTMAGPFGGDITLRGEVYSTDDYNLREFDFPWTIQKGYTTYNAYATFVSADETYRINAFLKNGTDKDIRGGVLGFGGAIGSFQPPRVYGVELSMKLR